MKISCLLLVRGHCGGLSPAVTDLTWVGQVPPSSCAGVRAGSKGTRRDDCSQPAKGGSSQGPRGAAAAVTKNYISEWLKITEI